jgi:hypothetical protein
MWEEVPMRERLLVTFSTRECAELTFLARSTIRFWTRRGWLRPAVRRRGRSGHGWSCWQLLGFALIADDLAGNRLVGSYLGRMGVANHVRRLEGLAESELYGMARAQDPMESQGRQESAWDEETRADLVGKLLDDPTATLRRTVLLDRVMAAIKGRLGSALEMRDYRTRMRARATRAIGASRGSR